MRKGCMNDPHWYRIYMERNQIKEFTRSLRACNDTLKDIFTPKNKAPVLELIKKDDAEN